MVTKIGRSKKCATFIKTKFVQVKEILEQIVFNKFFLTNIFSGAKSLTHVLGAIYFFTNFFWTKMVVEAKLWVQQFLGLYHF